MDCFEARSRFFELTLSHGEAVDSGGTDLLRQHLGDCAECRTEFEAECARDRQLARVIRAINIPSGLNSRLIRSAAAQQVTLPASISATRPRLSRRRRAAWAASCLGVVACLSLALWMAWPVKLTLAELELLVERPNSAMSSPQEAPLERPWGWRQLASVTEQPESMVPPSVGVVHFAFRPRGATGAVTGRLWILPAARLAGAELIPDLAMAEMQYRPQITHLVWRESGTVYLLELGDDVSGLRRLQEALLRTRTVA